MLMGDLQVMGVFLCLQRLCASVVIVPQSQPQSQVHSLKNGIKKIAR